MDKEIQRGLSDRLYDKRKVAALELEASIRECLSEKDHDKIKQIIDQLCRDFAYAVHHPNARNGGLIGLAAAAIALGQNEVATYLEDIIHPVLACFGDQDARVRYYACESMYNIAKVSKGEILLYFNEIFDALAKLATDSEPSVKNGADLLDRLIKDIVSEKATTYVSVIQKKGPKLPQLEEEEDPSKPTLANEPTQDETTFSLPKFIPLLMERIYAINPYARMFLVSWITLLDSIPDLELVSYLPSFLGGLISFLSDPSKDVRVATQAALDGFLQEIRRITDIKKQVALNIEKRRLSNVSNASNTSDKPRSLSNVQSWSTASNAGDDSIVETKASTETGDNSSSGAVLQEVDEDDEYIPGQDVYVNFEKIIEILISHLDSSEQDIQLMVLNWIENLLEVSPLSMLPYGPRFLSVLLPTMAYDGKDLRHAAERVNKRMLDLITSLPDSYQEEDGADSDKIDYSATVNALTLHFLNEKEHTRVAALDWLIMLHRKVPRRILAINDATFPALLKTLSDPSELVITKDLQLLAQISYNSNDEYFTAFMVNLLNLFSTDRRLLETRGNLIIRQLCTSLNPERIYRTMAEILERDDDVEFASTMVQNLNSNLITAPELVDLRLRLREIDTNRDGAQFFVSLFRCWCHNSAAALSLCLLAQAYEHAFMVLQIVCEFEITVNLLVQIDKLVQLLESPVFTHLRLQLLEPEKYPYLYKCLYGILMVLPQSTAFATLRNRLNSVSPIGFLHPPASSTSRYYKTSGSGTTAQASQGATGSASTNSVANTNNSVTSLAPNKSRDDVRWGELLEKFRQVQRKHQEARSLEFTRSMSDLKLQMNQHTQQQPQHQQQPTNTRGLVGEVPKRGGAKGSDRSKSGPPQTQAKKSRGPFGLGRRFGDDNLNNSKKK